MGDMTGSHPLASDAFGTALAESAVFAVIDLDPQGTIRHWNAGAQRLFGHAEPEVLGLSIALLLPQPGAGERLAARLHLAREQGEAAVEGWHLARDGSRVWAGGAILSMPGAEAGFVCLLRDAGAARAEGERRVEALSTMPFQMRSMLATLQAVAMQSLAYNGAEGFRAAFGSRVAALGRALDPMGEQGWDDLDSLVRRVIAPLAQGRRLATGGPPLRLGADVVATFALMLWELADNAAAHGAWSVPGGAVSVYWSVIPAGEGPNRVAELVWREFDGPPVAWPLWRGFGMRMLHRSALPGGGTTQLQFHATGVECRMRLPAVAGVEELPPP